MSQSILTAPENIKWLSLQDLLRRRAQELDRVKLKLHVVALAVALVIPLASALGKTMAAHGLPDVSSGLVGLFAISGLAIEYVGQFIKNRMTKLHVISRRVLATVLPAEASGQTLSDESWRRVLEQSGIPCDKVSRWSSDPSNQKRFAKWWASDRSQADPDRLQALLLDNVIWTQAVLKRMVEKRTRWRLVAISGLVFLILSTAMLAPRSLPGIIEFLLVPLLLFALAVNGLNTTDLELWQDALDEIDAIHDMLRGIDNRDDRNATIIALLGRYLGLTSAVPPISTQLYEEQLNELHQRVTTDALERHLLGR